MPEIDGNIDSEMESSSHHTGLYIDLDHYRKIVRNYIDLRRYKTALFWAEKVVVLSKYDPNDVYWQAQCMFLLREYHRAAHIIKLRGLEKTHVLCHYLAVESLLEAKEYQEAIEMLNAIDAEQLLAKDTDGSSFSLGHNSTIQTTPEDVLKQKSEIYASICLLKGKVLEAMDNRQLAMDCYVSAMQSSVYCTEALDALAQHEMLMTWEEIDLLTSLPFTKQCTEAETKLLIKVYRTKLKKYYEAECPSPKQTNVEQTTPVSSTAANTQYQSIKELTDKIKNERANDVKFGRQSSMLFRPVQQNILSPANKILQDLKQTSSYVQSCLSKNSFNIDVLPKPKISANSKTAVTLSVVGDRLKNSLDVMVAKAEKRFYNCEYRKCLQILDSALKEDPYHTSGLTVLIGCLVELKESNKLFYIAHKLVDLYPDQAISWYAVGCYYDVIGKSDPARRYLSKATTLDRLFGPAWLAYGHSFAKEKEHDQAMAAYFKATQLMRGCHLPLLYIGVECGLTKNLQLAEKFFFQAMSIAPFDVFVLHELGVIKFEYESYESAEEIFRTTLDMVTKLAKQNKRAISPRWEPLLNNLGHCCRKNKRYDDALLFHQQALVLKPQTASTYTAIGFVQALMGRLESAIESLHRSLALKRDDTVTSALLKYCIEDLMEENTLPENILEEVDILPIIPATPVKKDNRSLHAAAAAPAKLIGDGDRSDSHESTTAPPLVKQKLKYDDSQNDADASPNSEMDMSCDMSMDV